MCRLFAALIVAAITLECALAATVDASAQCMTNSGRRNEKDLYADPSDCHSYYQCFFVNDTYAVGYKRECAPLTYFAERVFACIWEGPVPCQDICASNANVPCATFPGSCSTYITCGSGSEVMCCPAGTVFNVNTCGCDADEAGTCKDVCTGRAQGHTSVAPPTVDGNTCIDSYKNKLTAGNNANEFVIIDDAAETRTTLPCAPGTTFSLQQCACGDFSATTATPASASQCFLYLPLNGSAFDYSQNKLETYTYDAVSYVNDSPSGSGQSAWFQGGTIEIPGTKSIDIFQSTGASWCAFFKCDNGACSNAGVLSNNNGAAKTDYSFIMTTATGNTVASNVRLMYPTSSFSVSANLQAGWNQVCTTTTSTTANIYVNNQLAQTKTLSNAFVAIGNYPYTVGNDQASGSFHGKVARVLICGHALTAAEVNAHYQGSAALAAANLIPA